MCLIVLIFLIKMYTYIDGGIFKEIARTVLHTHLDIETRGREREVTKNFVLRIFITPFKHCGDNGDYSKRN